MRSRPAGVGDGRSDLEVGAAETFRRGGLPGAVAHYHFVWCCQHLKGEHRPGVCLACVHELERGLTVRVGPNVGGALALHDYRHDRDWAFDLAWPARHIAVELEGGVHVEGRHVRGTGYENDCRKYNAAVLNGWRLLRFTDAMVESGEALETLEHAMRMGRGAAR